MNRSSLEMCPFVYIAITEIARVFQLIEPVVMKAIFNWMNANGIRIISAE